MALTYNDRSRRVSDDRAIFSHALRNNPLLSAASGAALAAGGCTTPGSALVMSLTIAAVMPLLGYVSAVERERIRPERRLAAYCAIAAAVIFVLSLIMDSIVLGCVETIGVYVPLMAVDPLVLSRTSPDAPILTRREACLEGLACALAFALTALPVGVIRGLLGSGKLFGLWLGFSGNDVFTHPFIGFIFCGLTLALIRRLTAQPERASAGKEGK